MKEYDLFMSLLDDDMLNINGVLIKNYRKLNITEKDIIVLSYLTRQEVKGYHSFVPALMKKKIALTQEELFESLANLEKLGYLDIRTEINPKTNKEGEFFYLNKLYQEIINIYTSKNKSENKRTPSFNEEISNLFEELFHKQMSPLDADIIRCWGEEKKFSLEDIKNEMLDQAKMGKTSLKSVDQALIKKQIIKEQSPEYIETNRVIDKLKEKWKK